MNSSALLVAVLVAVAVFIILVVLFLVRRQRQGLQRPVLPPLGSNQSSSAQSETVSRETQEVLLKLLNGDRTTAERLVQNVRNRNPDKSETWCWEKVISDIERDRR